MLHLSKKDLLAKCIELGINNCKSKTKSEIIDMINAKLSVMRIDDNVNDNDNVNVNDNNIDTHNDKLKMIDLFAGTGAFSYAFESTDRVACVFANDMLDSSEMIYNMNHSVKITKQNLNDIDVANIPEHDILTGGFPCQPFSIAGKQQGFNDARSNVFWKILDIIRLRMPKVVVLENVKNLQSHDEGRTFTTIIDSLKDIGYHIKFAILNTCKLSDVPQNRERIYIVCFRDAEMYDRFDFDFEDARAVSCKPISDFLEVNVPDKYYYTSHYAVYDELKKNMTKNISTNTVYQYRRYYVRENKNGVCPTLTANMGSGGHNVPLILDDKGIRKLTPRECFNLQGFPRDYQLPALSDSKLYSLAGNAVSVPIVMLISKKIANLL